jgi:antitoxin VapB
MSTRRLTTPPPTTAKLFMNGRSQAVRLPQFCRFEGQQVYVEKVGDQVILTPYRPSWQAFFADAERPSDDFMAAREMQFAKRAPLE